MGSIPAAKLGIFDAIEKAYSNLLPFYDMGLGWILPALIGAFIGCLFPARRAEKFKYKMIKSTHNGLYVRAFRILKLSKLSSHHLQ